MKKIYAANWKMHKSPKEARTFFGDLKSAAISDSAHLIIFPSSPCLEAASDFLAGNKIEFGSQNSHFESSGAFTGETSPLLVLQLGGKWALLGHSERRTLFAETSELVAKKARAAQGLGLTPMVCIGELLNERDEGRTNDILARQLTESLSGVDPSRGLVIAYEPVWAIGTGRVAGPDQVRDAHEFIYDYLGKLGFKEVPILYGGSVKPENAGTLVHIPHVDGFLIGGASLDVASFLKIASASN